VEETRGGIKEGGKREEVQKGKRGDRREQGVGGR